jgi:hypothetical protein
MVAKTGKGMSLSDPDEGEGMFFYEEEGGEKNEKTYSKLSLLYIVYILSHKFSVHRSKIV